MIRVGFVVSFTGKGWVGGINYYKSLLGAISGSKTIQPVIFAGNSIPDSVISELGDHEVLRHPLVAPNGPIMKSRKVLEALYGRGVILESFLRSHGVSVLSHSGHLGPRSTFPTIGWIPDFQHLRLPEFFSEKERRDRDRGFARLCDFCTRIVVSSEDAKGDLVSFRPSAADKAEVLHFVPGVEQISAASGDEIASRYGISGPYFHVPNQFWAHKNHGVIVDAIAALRQSGQVVNVVSTGATSDSRNPNYFDDLMKRASAAGVEDSFRVLGLVPFRDLNALMRNSVALINPSLFEGWSTTVEEAKSLGKAIILSDIPVHREQAPPRGMYFPPRDPAALAAAMRTTLERYASSDEDQFLEAARTALPKRVSSFAERYEQIVTAALGHA